MLLNLKSSSQYRYVLVLISHKTIVTRALCSFAARTQSDVVIVLVERTALLRLGLRRQCTCMT